MHTHSIFRINVTPSPRQLPAARTKSEDEEDEEDAVPLSGLEGLEAVADDADVPIGAACVCCCWSFLTRTRPETMASRRTESISTPVPAAAGSAAGLCDCISGAGRTSMSGDVPKARVLVSSSSASARTVRSILPTSACRSANSDSWLIVSSRDGSKGYKFGGDAADDTEGEEEEDDEECEEDEDAGLAFIVGG